MSDAFEHGVGEAHDRRRFVPTAAAAQDRGGDRAHEVRGHGRSQGTTGLQHRGPEEVRAPIPTFSSAGRC